MQVKSKKLDGVISLLGISVPQFLYLRNHLCTMYKTVPSEKKLKSKRLLISTATIQNLCIKESTDTASSSLETAEMKRKGNLLSIYLFLGWAVSQLLPEKDSKRFSIRWEALPPFHSHASKMGMESFSYSFSRFVQAGFFWRAAQPQWWELTLENTEVLRGRGWPKAISLYLSLSQVWLAVNCTPELPWIAHKCPCPVTLLCYWALQETEEHNVLLWDWLQRMVKSAWIRTSRTGAGMRVLGFFL